MAKYTVVVHYEGAWNTMIEAEDEDEARELAADEFEAADIEEVIESMDWEICDVWEE